MNVKSQTQPWIRDASQDRQPEIHSTLMREDFQRIMEQTNKDCRFRNFTLTNSLHQQHLLVGTQDSRLRYVLVHNFPAEAMLWIKEVEMVESVDDLNFRVLSEKLPGSNFELLDARIASTLNKFIQNTHFQEKGQSGGNESSQRRPIPSKKTTSGSPVPVVLSRIMQTYLQLFFEMMIFRNSIRNGTEFYYQ